MASLEIGGNPVTIGGDTIDFIVDVRANQFALVSPIASGTNGLRSNQIALVAVADPPPAPMRVNQIAIVVVSSPNIVVVSPNRAIGLECWQPCLSYGTNALVYWKEI